MAYQNKTWGLWLKAENFTSNVLAYNLKLKAFSWLFTALNARVQEWEIRKIKLCLKLTAHQNKTYGLRLKSEDSKPYGSKLKAFSGLDIPVLKQISIDFDYLILFFYLNRVGILECFFAERWSDWTLFVNFLFDRFSQNFIYRLQNSEGINLKPQTKRWL